MGAAISEAAETTTIDGLLVIRLKQISDGRGTIREFYRRSAFEGGGPAVAGPWAQINVTETREGALRGLHGEAMTKLVAIVHGSAFGAYVDTRAGSPTRGAVATVPLEKGTQVLVPAGVCNGFQSLGPGSTQYVYCFDREWEPGMPGVAVNPLDPALGIRWPMPVDVDDRDIISEKDRNLPTLASVLGG